MNRRVTLTACTILAVAASLASDSVRWLVVGLLAGMVLAGFVTWARIRYSDPEKVAAREWRREHPIRLDGEDRHHGGASTRGLS